MFRVGVVGCVDNCGQEAATRMLWDVVLSGGAIRFGTTLAADVPLQNIRESPEFGLCVKHSSFRAFIRTMFPQLRPSSFVACYL